MKRQFLNSKLPPTVKSLRRTSPLLLLLLVWLLPAAQAFGQKKTNTHSPCLNAAANYQYEFANLDYAPCQAAADSLRAAALIAVGLDIDKYADDWVKTWLNTISFEIPKEKFEAGLSIKDVSDYLLNKLVVSESNFKNHIGKSAYDVYGEHLLSDADYAFYTAQIKSLKGTYLAIFTAKKSS